MTDNTDTTTPYTGPDYGFGDDNALAHQITSFDRFADTQSPMRVLGAATNAKAPELTVEALSPSMRQPILAELARVSGDDRAQVEAQLVRRALQQGSLDFRIAAGLSEDADPYQRTVFDLANRLRLIEHEENQILADLDEVRGYTTGTDPETGKPVSVPVMALSANSQSIARNRLTELGRQRAHIQGAEGDEERRRALSEAIEHRKGIKAQLQDAEEAKRRAADAIREERIARLADGYAKSMRTQV